MEDDYSARKQTSRVTNHFPPGYDHMKPPGTYSRQHHFANNVPLLQRLVYTALAVTLISYGAIGILVDALPVFGRRTVTILSGTPAWLAFGALCAGAAGLISVVIDHYDRRNNVKRYQAFQQMSLTLMFVLYIAAPLWHLWETVRGS